MAENPSKQRPLIKNMALISAGALVTFGVMRLPNLPNLVFWPFNQGASSSAQTFQLAENQVAPSKTKHHMFSDSSELIADVAEALSPSVVNIDIQKMGRPMAQNPFGDEIFQRFFGFSPGGPQPMQQAPVVKGNGSGVIISAQGHILTNNHVVQGASDITISLSDGRKVKARLVGADPYSDLAVLKMDNVTHLKPAKLGNSTSLRPGEWVIAIGSPLGFDHTVTLGIVSALSRQVPDINANLEFIQTDAAINPGNSGGPLVNLDGEVIGINTAIAGSGQNIGFAIPVNIAKKTVNDILTNGKVAHPWVGVSLTQMSPELAKSLGMPGTIEGVIIAQVVLDSPAFRAGLQEGDIIQRLNGVKIKTPKEIQETVRSKPLNTEIPVQILRNGQMLGLTLRTGTMPDSFGKPD
jgi:serine protease Do